MYLKSLELSGFKSFAKKTTIEFTSLLTAIVGPNGSGKSNIAEAFRFVLGEQSLKSMRGRRGEDLIWNGSRSLARSNRASVRLLLDNSKGTLPIDFDEVVIERVVHRDGVNEYLVNGSHVRLRDILRLLGSAHIGPSKHQLVSQGEADRILFASPTERREMTEEALGLKVYYLKRQESAKKLEEAEKNLKSVETLRHEISPHLKFLRRQMEKVERAGEIQRELTSLCLDYLAREDFYLKRKKHRLTAEKLNLDNDLSNLESEGNRLEAASNFDASRVKLADEIAGLSERIEHARSEREALLRTLGRIEGELNFLERRGAAVGGQGEAEKVSLSEFSSLAREISTLSEEGERAYNLTDAQVLFRRIRSLFTDFMAKLRGASAADASSAEIERLTERKNELNEKVKNLSEEIIALEKKVRECRENVEWEQQKGKEMERRLFEVRSKQGELVSRVSFLNEHLQELSREEEDFKRELQEIDTLIGPVATNLHESTDRSEIEAFAVEPRSVQEERRRRLEKLKLRLEEYGVGNTSDIEREFREVSERNDFLAREIEDLRKSASSLRSIMAEIEEQLSTEFDEGIRSINHEFERLFMLMFGGGMASLKVIEPPKRLRGASVSEIEEGELSEEESERGIEITVALPHKRIKGLEMLSGGERALCSIALIFAISQVHPPPFFVLDETDAAFDEANSQKYGNLIEELAKHSQLILITHNRETMSRAGVLYGVTMGSDSVSRLLSVKFDEALKVAQ